MLFRLLQVLSATYSVLDDSFIIKAYGRLQFNFSGTEEETIGSLLVVRAPPVSCASASPTLYPSTLTLTTAAQDLNRLCDSPDDSLNRKVIR